MKTTSIFKPVLVIIAVLVILGLGYAATAYSLHMWPFKSVAQTESDSIKATDRRQEQALQDAAKKKVAAIPKYNLSFKTDLKTKEQGNCTLTMKMGDHVLNQSNSTVGKKGKHGCQTWKLDTSTLPAGKYDVTVTFTGEHSKETTKQQITLPPKK